MHTYNWLVQQLARNSLYTYIIFVRVSPLLTFGPPKKAQCQCNCQPSGLITNNNVLYAPNRIKKELRFKFIVSMDTVNDDETPNLNFSETPDIDFGTNDGTEEASEHVNNRSAEQQEIDIDDLDEPDQYLGPDDEDDGDNDGNDDGEIETGEN